jgi:hypothetical protein
MDKSLARGYRRQFDRNITKSNSDIVDVIVDITAKYINKLEGGKRLTKKDILNMSKMFQSIVDNEIVKNCIIHDFSQSCGLFGVFLLGEFEEENNLAAMGRLLNCIWDVQRRRITMYNINSSLTFDKHLIQRIYERIKSDNVIKLDFSIEIFKCEKIFNVMKTLHVEPNIKIKPIALPFDRGLILGICTGQENDDVKPYRVDFDPDLSPAICSVKFDQRGGETTVLPQPRTNTKNYSQFVIGRMATYIPPEMLTDSQIELRDLLEKFYKEHSEAIDELHKCIVLCVVRSEKLTYEFPGAQSLIDAAGKLFADEGFKNLKLPKKLFGRDLAQDGILPTS